MRKLLIVALAAGFVLATVNGCKKKVVEPKDMGAEVARIMSGDDCAKVAKELESFLADNSAKWQEYAVGVAKAEAKNGNTDADSIFVKAFFNGDKSLYDKVKNAKCGSDAAVKTAGKKMDEMATAVSNALADKAK